LARRIAEQVKASGLPFTLEPMPAYERRIIHLTLADNPDVTTESIGTGEARRVVISPKEH
jgi:spoIIIJ-associated protein